MEVIILSYIKTKVIKRIRHKYKKNWVLLCYIWKTNRHKDIFINADIFWHFISEK